MLIHLASIEPLRKELQQFLCGPGNPIAGHLDHGIHHRSRALPGVSKICSDTDDFRLFRLSPVKKKKRLLPSPNTLDKGPNANPFPRTCPA